MSVCKEKNLNMDSIGGLAILSGAQLTTLKEKQFCKISDNIVGPILYKRMKKLRKELREATGNYLLIYCMK